jgi:hypothetical protein
MIKSTARNSILLALAMSLTALAGCEAQQAGGPNDNAPPGFRRVKQQGPDGGVQGFRPSGLGDFKISGGSQSN